MKSIWGVKVEQDDDFEQNNKPEQCYLFELEFSDYTPSGLGTAHLSGFALASDEMEYAVKGAGGNTPFPVQNPTQVPAAEWFCTNLAERCGIATPVCKILKCVSNNEYVFGSRIEHAAWKSGLSDSQWIQLLSSASDSLKKQLWAIYAFDQFVHNVDRHLNNYLYMHNSRGQVIVKTFDFSLSSFVLGWPRSTSITLPSDSTTRINWRIVKMLIGDTDELRKVSLNVLDKLEMIGVNAVSDILNTMPGEWLPPMQKDFILRWWDNLEKIERLNAIRLEITS